MTNFQIGRDLVYLPIPRHRRGAGASAARGIMTSPSPITTTVGTAINTTIATLSVLGGTGTYTYTLTSNPGGLFKISGSQLQVAAALSIGFDPITIHADNGAGSVFDLTTSVQVLSGVTAVNLSGTTLSNLGAQNAGAVIGAITVVGTQSTPVVIGGPDAAKFAVTNGGIVPCNLVAAVDIPAGSYSITLSAT